MDKTNNRMGERIGKELNQKENKTRIILEVMVFVIN